MLKYLLRKLAALKRHYLLDKAIVMHSEKMDISQYQYGINDQISPVEQFLL